MAAECWRGGVGLDTHVALAACVVLGSGLCGRAAAEAVRRRTRTLAELCEGLRALRIRMTGMLESVQCAMSRSNCPLLELVAGGMGEGCSAQEAWQATRRKAIRRGGPADSLSEADLRALDDFFTQLGKSDRQAQEVLLDGTQETLARQLEVARGRAAEADRLYVTLGILVGVMLALIVI